MAFDGTKPITIDIAGQTFGVVYQWQEHDCSGAIGTEMHFATKEHAEYLLRTCQCDQCCDERWDSGDDWDEVVMRLYPVDSHSWNSAVNNSEISERRINNNQSPYNPTYRMINSSNKTAAK